MVVNERLMQARLQKGWHSRGYLPHLDALQLTQFVTFRLADSVPAELIARWKSELERGHKQTSRAARNAALRRRIEQYADAGHGACVLRDADIARIVQDALLYFDPARYRLLAWCIMPSHVHTLLELGEKGYPLSNIVHSWKSFTAHEVNRHLNRCGQLWMPDYFDRYIRDQEHLDACVHYIHQNPVKAGLVQTAEDWLWSG